MFVCVKLKNSKKYLVVKKEWIKDLDEILESEEVKNHGLNCLKRGNRKFLKIFVSPVETDEANFDAITKDKFDENEENSYCYNAEIVMIFGW